LVSLLSSPFGSFSLTAQLRRHKGVNGRIEAVFAFKGLNGVHHYGVVEIFTAELMISIRPDDPNLLARHMHERDVERPPSEVVDQHRLVLCAAFHAEGDRRSGWLVDQIKHLEAR